MKSRYAGAILLIACTGAAVGWVWGGRLEPAALRGALLGTALATMGALAGMALTAWSFGRDEKIFFAALVLGILGRLVGYGAALVYVALRTSIDPMATAAALLGFYVVFQIIEVRHAARGMRGSRG